MSEFDFEELIADMLDISDSQRDDPCYVENKFYEEFSIDIESGYQLAKRLIYHTVPVESGMMGNEYHGFISKSAPVLLMKVKTTEEYERVEE